MMKEYCREEVIAEMNRMGTESVPFLFIISYDGSQTLLSPLSEVDPEECLFCFHGIGNATDMEPAPKDYHWHVEPPCYETYRRSFSHVRDGILFGNSYLANLTCRVAVDTDLGFQEIYRSAHASYRLWLRDKLVCFSPETFVRIKDCRISSFPMKGTIAADSHSALETLMRNDKEAAEHATIVDLIRNDLSIVAHHVRVERYRYADLLHTNKGDIYQTSSEITGVLPADWRCHLGDILFSQLPAGSITGAPKPCTMRIIAEAEGYERGFYTGVMGCFMGEAVDSAVMIRFMDTDGSRVWFKAGGGITAKSQCREEYDEVVRKVYLPF